MYRCAVVANKERRHQGIGSRAFRLTATAATGRHRYCMPIARVAGKINRSRDFDALPVEERSAPAASSRRRHLLKYSRRPSRAIGAPSSRSADGRVPSLRPGGSASPLRRPHSSLCSAAAFLKIRALRPRPRPVPASPPSICRASGEKRHQR